MSTEHSARTSIEVTSRDIPLMGERAEPFGGRGPLNAEKFSAAPFELLPGGVTLPQALNQSPSRDVS
jgi:hypothetical protein